MQRILIIVGEILLAAAFVSPPGRAEPPAQSYRAETLVFGTRAEITVVGVEEARARDAARRSRCGSSSCWCSTWRCSARW